jgi:MtN3 and saliva related transmembrane protein
MIEIIGYIAASLTTVSFLPQAIQTIKTRNTQGISLLMYALFTVGVGFWLTYGILINNKTIIIANIITLTLAMIVLLVKIWNCQKNKT